MSLRRILNVPKRGLRDKAEAALVRHAARYGVSFGVAIADAAGEERSRGGAGAGAGGAGGTTGGAGGTGGTTAGEARVPLPLSKKPPRAPRQLAQLLIRHRELSVLPRSYRLQH